MNSSSYFFHFVLFILFCFVKVIWHARQKKWCDMQTHINVRKCNYCHKVDCVYRNLDNNNNIYHFFCMCYQLVLAMSQTSLKHSSLKQPPISLMSLNRFCSVSWEVPSSWAQVSWSQLDSLIHPVNGKETGWSMTRLYSVGCLIFSRISPRIFWWWQ